MGLGNSTRGLRAAGAGFSRVCLPVTVQPVLIIQALNCFKDSPVSERIPWSKRALSNCVDQAKDRVEFIQPKTSANVICKARGESSGVWKHGASTEQKLDAMAAFAERFHGASPWQKVGDKPENLARGCVGLCRQQCGAGWEPTSRAEQQHPSPGACSRAGRWGMRALSAWSSGAGDRGRSAAGCVRKPHGSRTLWLWRGAVSWAWWSGCPQPWGAGDGERWVQEEHPCIRPAGSSLCTLLRSGASRLVLAAAGWWTVSLTMQRPRFSLLPNSCEARPRGSQSQRGAQAREKPADVALLLPDSPCSQTGKMAVC